MKKEFKNVDYVETCTKNTHFSDYKEDYTFI